MMGFTVRGTLRDVPNETVSVTWDDGVVSGDPPTAAIIEGTAHALARRQWPVGPVSGPYRSADYLAHGLSALHLIVGLFEPSTVEVFGRVPVPEVEPGLNIIH